MCWVTWQKQRQSQAWRACGGRPFANAPENLPLFHSLTVASMQKQNAVGHPSNRCRKHFSQNRKCEGGVKGKGRGITRARTDPLDTINIRVSGQSSQWPNLPSTIARCYLGRKCSHICEDRGELEKVHTCRESRKLLPVTFWDDSSSPIVLQAQCMNYQYENHRYTKRKYIQHILLRCNCEDSLICEAAMEQASWVAIPEFLQYTILCE